MKLPVKWREFRVECRGEKASEERRAIESRAANRGKFWREELRIGTIGPLRIGSKWGCNDGNVFHRGIPLFDRILLTRCNLPD